MCIQHCVYLDIQPKDGTNDVELLQFILHFFCRSLSSVVTFAVKSPWSLIFRFVCALNFSTKTIIFGGLISFDSHFFKNRENEMVKTSTVFKTKKSSIFSKRKFWDDRRQLKSSKRGKNYFFFYVSYRSIEFQHHEKNLAKILSHLPEWMRFNEIWNC